MRKNNQNKNGSKRLILFDIDGTLITSGSIGKKYWKQRVIKAFQEAHGLTLKNNFDSRDYNGLVDKHVFWKIASSVGISREHFEQKFSIMKSAFHRHLKKVVEESRVRYKPIKDAQLLVERLLKEQDYVIGLITGNTEQNAWFKLQSASMAHYFKFGVFGDEVDDRESLARLAVTKASKYFNEELLQEEIVMVGDTIHDIRAGKAINAKTIAVTSGLTGTRDELVKAGADLVVDTLMDELVFNFLRLKR